MNDNYSEPFFTTRKVLWLVVFSGFTINYMIRVNLNLAIISMIKSKPTLNGSKLVSECISNSLEDVSTQTDIFSQDDLTKFDWNEKEQGKVLGSFFWLHWLPPIPGGFLAIKYGTKKVYGFSQLFAILWCFLIPRAAYLGTIYLLILRMIQGFCLGFAWPSMHSLIAKWIPPNERSTFVAAYMGNSFGVALTYAICGFIIAKWGWELVFYICGSVGLIWCMLWWILVYDHPADHPRISNDEKQYIISSLQDTVTVDQEFSVPWIKILTSKQVWIATLSQFGNFWGLSTLLTYAPKYFKFIHGWSIESAGLLSGFPHVCRVVWAFTFSQFADYLLRTNIMSPTNVRKLGTVSSNIVQGLFMLVLAYSGCDWLLAITFLTLSVAAQGAVSSGSIAGVVDISPNYASVICGITNTFVTANGFITPVIVSFIISENQTTSQWQMVYWLAAIVTFSTGLIDIIFTKSVVKSWNSPICETNPSRLPETELMVLKGSHKIGEAKSLKL